ncbi:thiamine phosphate synthase [Clostridium sp. BJN0001]|uniref:thiamine phosphate synthase n=1 Tax=Clostridium sp. BJN0001 TaxID=2930219 RepID=UPI001FD41893|nr:thiamine phosphate synthase [Clostridium sp. BJN0001]
MLVFGITNRKLCDDFYSQIEKISLSSIDYLILREKDLSYDELLKMACKVKEILKKSNIKLIINSSVDVAKKIDAYGVQLSFNDFKNLRRKNESIYKRVGVSIHSFEEGIEAQKLGATYVIYGHVFETECKKGLKPRGTSEIKKMSEVMNIKIIGLGGINKNNYKEVIKNGASGIAVMSGIMRIN